jgi:hypothetical protein
MTFSECRKRKLSLHGFVHWLLSTFGSRGPYALWLVPWLIFSAVVADAQDTAGIAQSPVNQVFQFMQTGTATGWADGAKTTATAYLWLPEHTKHLRGLLVMGSNVPENMLVGNPEIRAVAAANDLGIVWSTPTFWYSKAKNEDAKVVAFLQQLLDGLAQTSGYEEVTTVPWIPMGESGHLLMVDALVEAAPERCIAGIWMKNPHLPPHNRTVPALVIFGTAQEWGQDKADYTTRWNDTSFYKTVLAERQQNPDWPLTFVMDGTSGHFDVSERLVHYIAQYIDAVAKARLPADATAPLRKIDLNQGYLADLPLPGRDKSAPMAYEKVAPEKRVVPWFFTRTSAAEAQAIADINWQATSQLIGFADGAGNIAPFDFNGISSITPKMDADGITFHLHAVQLDALPSNFVNAGAPLAKGPAAPVLQWMSGAVAPVGGDALQVALDRTWRQQAIYYVGRATGSADVRAAVQPVAIKLKKNDQGSPQKITFAPIQNVKVGTKSVSLSASSDSGLPVRFFVVAGPAIVQGNQLVFTSLPPRTKLPATVTVAAWQWGRDSAPQIKTAEIVRQQFLLEK